MHVGFLSPNEPTWRQALARVPHEFYHWPEYAALEAARMQAEPAALFVREANRFLLLPILLREIPLPGANGLRDAISPYGYPGPIVQAGAQATEEFVRRVLGAAAEVLAQRGVISLFVRLHPLLNDARLLAGPWSIVQHGPVFWMDLGLPAEALLAGMRRGFRYDVRNALRSGLDIGFDEQWEHLDDFIRLYHATMDRVGAAPSYYLDRDYFLALRSVLGQELRLCVAKRSGRVLAACLFGQSGGTVQYLYSASDKATSNVNATKAIIAFVRDWAKLRGHQVFFLGGGVGGREDKLGEFKRGFTKLSASFFTLRMICDEGNYERIVSEYQQRTGQKPEDLVGYFPAYRKPAGTDFARAGSPNYEADPVEAGEARQRPLGSVGSDGFPCGRYGT